MTTIRSGAQPSARARRFRAYCRGSALLMVVHLLQGGLPHVEIGEATQMVRRDRGRLTHGKAPSATRASTKLARTRAISERTGGGRSRSPLPAGGGPTDGRLMVEMAFRPRRHTAAHQQRHPVPLARERDLGGGVMPHDLVLAAHLIGIEARRGHGGVYGRGFFFAPCHRPVERAGVDRNAEPPRHGRRQRFVRLHVFARAPALDVVDNRLGAFVGVLRPGTLGHQPGDPVRLERGRGLVERLAADPEARGNLGHRPSIDLVAAHHLVLDLDAVARVEERMAHKGVVADGLGVRMQGPCLAQGLRLGVRR